MPLAPSPAPICPLDDCSPHLPILIPHIISCHSCCPHFFPPSLSPSLPPLPLPSVMPTSFVLVVLLLAASPRTPSLSLPTAAGPSGGR